MDKRRKEEKSDGPLRNRGNTQTPKGEHTWQPKTEGKKTARKGKERKRIEEEKEEKKKKRKKAKRKKEPEGAPPSFRVMVFLPFPLIEDGP